MTHIYSDHITIVNSRNSKYIMCFVFFTCGYNIYRIEFEHGIDDVAMQI